MKDTRLNKLSSLYHFTLLRAVRQVYHFINGSLADCAGVAALSPTSVHRPRIVDRMDIDRDKSQTWSHIAHTLLIHLTFDLHLSCCMSCMLCVLMCFAWCETVTRWDLTFDSFPSQKSTESLTRLKPQTGRCTEVYELYYGILLDYPLTNKPPSSSRFSSWDG